MAQISKGDFVEVEYTGKLKEEGIIFDTTDEAAAKESGIYSDNTEYGPAVVCIGEGQLLKGLEEELIGKEVGKEYEISLTPEKAFGKKDAKLIRMIPFSVFKKQNIMPEPGMQVNIDGVLATVKTASGGRCLVDFNHPFSGKDVSYKVKVLKIVTDDAEKVKSIIKLNFGMKADVSKKEEGIDIKTKTEVPKEIKDVIEKKILELVPSVKKVAFSAEPKPASK